MGLAASQARLLTITSRKADCEFLSMNLSHQKLALSRDMENISSAYQQAMNQTKLVYDYYGSGETNMPLTYGLLMTPSMYNDYYPKFVTDATNRVVLNSAYAQAARIAGIPTEGLLGTASSDMRNRFIEALMGENIISPTTAMEVESVTYNNVMGLGNQYEATMPTKEITYDELLTMLKAEPTAQMSGAVDGYGGLGGLYNGGIGAGRKAILQNNSSSLNGSYTYENGGFLNTIDDKYVHDDTSGTTALSYLQSLNLTDLLYNSNGTSSNNYIVGVLSADGENIPASEFFAIQYELSNNYLNWLYEAFSSVLGTSVESNLALQNAYNNVFDILCPTGGDIQNLYQQIASKTDADGNHFMDWSGSEWMSQLEDGGFYGICNAYMAASGVITHTNTQTRNYSSNWAAEAANKLGITFTTDTNYVWGGSAAEGETTHGWYGIFHSDSYDRTQCSISLSNLARAFLAEYVACMKSDDSSGTANLSYNSGTENLFNDISDFTFTIPDETEIEDYSNNLNAGFYDTMFNIISTQGWVENERVDDKDYMSQMMKNGMMFISSINSDGYYYQNSYSTDRAIVEVQDDDAIARAQAKYNTEKAKIESKENTIDMKMKNLDTEISSLTQEYDSVKQLINKSIERSIKRYEA